MNRREIIAAGAAIAWGAASGRAGAEEGDRLIPVLQTDLVFNGVTVSGDGRVFLPFQRQTPNEGIEVGEWIDGAVRPYPDSAWNAWREGMPAARAFVGVNAIRIGPDGALWVVDKGAPETGAPVLPGGPKVVRIDLATNRVARIYSLDSVTMTTSFVDDIRFNGGRAYLTDAGKPGIIVLDLESGAARRVLEGHPSTIAEKPLMGEGKRLTDKHGRPVDIHADQLEVSADGAWFYYQACSGPLYRIATRRLDDPAIGEAELASHVERYAGTASTGGTAIDADGTIYASDTDRLRILRIAADGSITTLIEDPRLVWIDAMWIDDAGDLWLPAAQMNRTPGMNGGRSALKPPYVVYKMKLGLKPVRR